MIQNESSFDKKYRILIDSIKELIDDSSSISFMPLN